mmetsp:Transcript_27438/g.64311  ORF Transcript_27438/g.64311 Transcript_27438/m.64311 type:complete len:203 (+) Transcript_27438:309-917(+)
MPIVLESFFVLDLASAAAFLARARSWWDRLALQRAIDLSARNSTLYWRGPIWSPNRFEASSVREQCSKSTYDKNLSQFPHFQRCPLGDLFRSKKLLRPKHVKWRQFLPLTGFSMAANVKGSRIGKSNVWSSSGVFISDCPILSSPSLSQSRTSVFFLTRSYISSRPTRLNILESVTFKSILDSVCGDRYRHKAKLNIYSSAS